MNIICVLNVAIGIFIVNHQTKGHIIHQSQENYLVDFSQSLKTIKGLRDDPNDYKEFIISKDKCVKL